MINGAESMSVTTITVGKFQGVTGLLAEQELIAALAICAGLANKEIARMAGRAPGTVKKSIERVFYKLGVSSRSAVPAELFCRGLIQVTPDAEHRDDSRDAVFRA